ncbi:hypothetical protein GUITHDRAFT_149105 [Guillardia theta CCMP2712]|uniref:Uncharacterized protein n=1 Tax=Guillardia theta (strain CCMP2712) TaxID=905079 RepID=L1I6M5_GUITC|nr:hypothetical protein GUITHDRAFT_149105 [Guillardia theta CCMP2712]EKX31732.1 hypothetical protein GUITHDRAFT_149105 [Guillardia theta CCMP2712]|eukprot:XP_005818712.1 hypothetical protein GUITHDRAFT_149105 [Guillardia theta CCMP2712]
MSMPGVPLLSNADRLPFTDERTFVLELLQPALLSATQNLLTEGLLQDGDIIQRAMKQDEDLLSGNIAQDELRISHHSSSFRVSQFHFDHFVVSIYQHLRADYEQRVSKLQQLLGNPTTSKNIINIVQAFSIIAFLHHDSRTHHFSDVGVSNYPPSVWLRYWDILQNDRLNYRKFIVQYFFTMLSSRCKNGVQRVYAKAFADYLFDLGYKVVEERYNRYLYMDQEVYFPMVCDLQRAFLRGESEVGFWQHLGRCKCHGDGVTKELMRIAASDAYPLSIKIAIVTYLSWTHGFPFVNYLPNKQQFNNARSHRSWSLEVLERSKETFSKQIASRVQGAAFDCDRISAFLFRHLTFLHTAEYLMANNGNVCILCVDNKKCDLCMR